MEYLNICINARSMPRTRAEIAIKTKRWLESRRAHVFTVAHKAARKTAVNNMHSWGVYEEDLGVGAEFRREVDRGAWQLAEEAIEVKGIDWDALIAEQQAAFEAALQEWAVQEAFPAWWLMSAHLDFDSKTYGMLLKDEWMLPDGLYKDSCVPHVGYAPLRVVAAYSRLTVSKKRALPREANAGTPGPFLILREVGMIRRDRAGESCYYTLDFGNPAVPYSLR